MNNALRQLTLVRFREFIREPEALFWVFVFPILLAAGLGLAFRNRPPEVLTIGAVSSELARSLKQEKLLNVEEYSLPTGPEALADRQNRSARITGSGEQSGVSLRRHKSRGPHRPHARRPRHSAGRGPRRSGSFRRSHIARGRFTLYRLSDPGAAWYEPDGKRDLGHRIQYC